MMLDEEHARKPELLGGHHVFDEIVVALAVAGRAAARPGAAEQSEFHCQAPYGVTVAPRRRSHAAAPASGTRPERTRPRAARPDAHRPRQRTGRNPGTSHPAAAGRGSRDNRRKSFPRRADYGGRSPTPRDRTARRQRRAMTGPSGRKRHSAAERRERRGARAPPPAS